MMRVPALVICVLYAAAACGQSTAAFADSVRNAFHIPELSYAVTSSKKIMEMAALGKHSVDLPDTAALNDRFHIGSNTKAMTAFLIAKYVEQGKLKWSTRFFDLFPGWKKTSHPAYAGITLQQLLSHRAGIPPFQGENDPEIPSFKGSHQQQRKQFARFVLTQEPVMPDKENPFVYSNAGYTLAALMVEKVTGNSWEQLLQKVFNNDLKLDVKLSWPENQRHKDTWGHLSENGKLAPVPSSYDYHLDYTEPAGDINIRLTDYARFIQMNLEGLSGKDDYLKAATWRFLHNGMPHYAMGWFNITENNGTFSSHTGTGAFTYYSNVQIDREKKIAYIVFANAYNDDTKQGVRLLMRKLKENYGQ